MSDFGSWSLLAVLALVVGSAGLGFMFGYLTALGRMTRRISKGKVERERPWPKPPDDKPIGRLPHWECMYCPFACYGP